MLNSPQDFFLSAADYFGFGVWSEVRSVRGGGGMERFNEWVGKCKRKEEGGKWVGEISC